MTTGAGYVSLDLVRQNYSKECEDGVNKQINLELFAMYSYLSLSYFYDRADVALPNFAAYFKKCADEEKEHAEKFMKFQNQRGGVVVLKDIETPKQNEWKTGIEGLHHALQLERDVNDALLKLHAVADEAKDYQMADFIEGNYLHEQVEAIKELTGHICNLERVGKTGHGEYHFDRASLS